ncbi:MAG: redox-regulated ATPase YchF, partial [Oscillospiraceae bacterium]
PSENYPFCTIEPNVGVVAVPDYRLDVLGKIYNTQKITPAIIEFVDIAGLVKGASKGEGLGNKFLSNIRETDAIVHVVRCFDSGDIVHVDGSTDPARDIETIDMELIFSDIEFTQRRLEKSRKLAKGDKSALFEVEFLERLLKHLEDGKNARTMPVEGEKEEIVFASIPLLSAKPVIYAANVSEDDLLSGLGENKYVPVVEKIAKDEGARCIPICAKTEEDVCGMDNDEKKEFLAELGLTSTGLEKLIVESYDLLGLISFLTAGTDEVRAWTIKKGTKAPGAAGKIHSDFERGFIRAEIVAFEDLMTNGTMAAAKEKGLVRSEGKEYVMADGDVTLFRF